MWTCVLIELYDKNTNRGLLCEYRISDLITTIFIVFWLVLQHHQNQVRFFLTVYDMFYNLPITIYQTTDHLIDDSLCCVQLEVGSTDNTDICRWSCVCCVYIVGLLCNYYQVVREYIVVKVFLVNTQPLYTCIHVLYWW